VVVSAANSAARKRLRTSDQGPRAAEDQEAPRPGEPGSDGSGLRADADSDPKGLAAVDLDEDLETEEDFDDLDADAADLADDAEIQAALADEDLDADDIGDAADVVLAGEEDAPDEPEGPDESDELDGDEGSEPVRPSAAASTGAEGAGVASVLVVKLSSDSPGEDEEILVFGDDDDDLPAAQVAVAGATADPVKDYLKQIGKVPLLNAEQEVELAKRIEAGLFAEEKLAEGRLTLSTDGRIDLEWIAEDGTRAKNHLLEANLRLVVSLAKRYTGRGMLFLDLIQEGNLGLIPAGDHPGDGRSGPDDPDSGAYGRGDQQAGPGAAADAAGPGPRADSGGAGGRAGHDPGEGHRGAEVRPGADLAAYPAGGGR